MTVQIDMGREAVARREAEIDRRTAGTNASGAARTAERRAALAKIESEELAALEAEAERAEATVERLRIRGVVRLGADMVRPRQALRASLLTPIHADTARALLEAMPRDDAAAPEAMAVPGHAAFGSPAAQAERRRIAGAFSRPEAAGRFAAVAALILDSTDSLTGEQIASVLTTIPPEAQTVRQPSLAERAAGHAEFGGDLAPSLSKAEHSTAVWKQAVEKANRAIGVDAAHPISPASIGTAGL